MVTRRNRSSTRTSISPLWDAATGIVLDNIEQGVLEALPVFPVAPVGAVLVALEAKACLVNNRNVAQHAPEVTKHRQPTDTERTAA